MSESSIVKHKEQPFVPIVSGVATPRDIEGVFRIGQLFTRAGMLPNGVASQEQVIIMLMAGLEVGLSPTQAIQNVMVVNNRPTIWGDAAIGLVWASEKMESHDEGIMGEGDARQAFCTVKRKGDEKPYTVTFSVQDAKNAGLWGKGGPWKNYPDRMLKLRARAFALRDKFADVLKGLGIREEVEDFDLPSKSVVSVVVDDAPRRSLNDKLATDATIEQPKSVETQQEPERKPKPKTKRPAFDDAGNPVDDLDAVLEQAKDISPETGK